jgi:hypothetical protein
MLFFHPMKGAICCPLNMCCWLLPIESSSLLLFTYMQQALANTGIISATQFYYQGSEGALVQIQIEDK